MKLEPGDKVWVTQEDDAERAGWAVWDGKFWTSPYGVRWSSSSLRAYVYGNSLRLKQDPTDDFGLGYEYMAEQLIAEGAM
jgi:hypothetical protein